MIRTASIQSGTDDDPLTLAMRPSLSETDSVRRLRIQTEQEQKQISDKIDEDIRQERERLRKARYDVKLLLLGQAASGKSTLLKQFQLMYTPQILESQSESWRLVIYFNVVRTIKHILHTLESWDDLPDNSEAAMQGSDDNIADDSVLGHISRQPSQSTGQSPTAEHSESSSSRALSPDMTNGRAMSPQESGAYHIANLRRRLSPLVATDEQLANRLSGGITVSGSGKGSVFVRSGWQTQAVGPGTLRSKRTKRDVPGSPEPTTHDILIEDVRRMLELSVDDIRDLWTHPTVRALIDDRRLKLDEWSEFFLHNINTIASREYVPSIDDILHARIQTMGVAEHCFEVSIHGREGTLWTHLTTRVPPDLVSVNWRLFDVGGARGQRHSWAPYFSDATAIIFMAPVSAFDQYLEEDHRTNRIDDSLQLFTQICSNQLLKNAHLVLFLNKTDLLRQKLAAGLPVRKYITSYGSRPNEFDSVIHYFRAHFQQVHRKNNETKRVLYTHLTSVVDTKTTQSIIGDVRDSIFRELLKSAALV